MDDSCAVCAENLEWVAYGSCGHRDVCSTCVARLRFICDDRRCCICKTESSVVFVTKALGDYTKVVSDFSSAFPSEPKEGRLRNSYWYHEDTQAFFDDSDHYRMIKAMCRLTCTTCDNAEDNIQQHQQQEDGPAPAPGGPRKKPNKFRSMTQLKGHLFHQHRLFMCDLCLEGRKVFICEQKLYTKHQLSQHKRTGDSQVDGTESERGGFAGHPMCEFCRTSFYGENELYSHMQTEHYTCHICQRRHPGQYEYYRDYDDLEAHFRHEHLLCEDEACLAKKFIVFQSEAELKRHNALEHGGRMSRSKRNAVLQIPTSFRYRSNNDSGQHRGRRRSLRPEPSPDDDLSIAIQASLERVRTDGAVPDSSSSTANVSSVHDDLHESDMDTLVQPFESLGVVDPGAPSRYRQAVSQSSVTAPLGESSFPPLAAAPTNQASSQQDLGRSNQNTMAARLRRQNNAKVLNVGRPSPASSRGSSTNSNPWSGAAPASSSQWPVPVASPAPAQVRSVPPAQVRSVTATVAPTPVSGQVKAPVATSSGSSSYATSLQTRAEPGGSWVSKNTGSSSRLNHSSSAPNLIDSRTLSDFPPVSASQSNKSQVKGQRQKVEDVQTANKSLVERIRAALDFDENKYSAFKEISQEYRQGLVGTLEYLEYVKQFDLAHLVIDLARLCPDPKKQQELIEAHNATSQTSVSQETFWGNGNIHVSQSGSSKDKGKKVLDSQQNNPKESLADRVINTVRTLQSQVKPQDGEVEVLEKDGYRASKGKSILNVGEKPTELNASNLNSGQTSKDGGGSKQKKKTSKFNRLRLGNSYSSTPTSDPSPAEADNGPSSEGPTRGVWRTGGAQKLFAK